MTEQELAECNLILYGGPEMNKLTARMADRLPVKFEDGRFLVGSAVYDQPTHCIAFLHPNPLSPKKYVLVYASNDPAALVPADTRLGPLRGERGDFSFVPAGTSIRCRLA